MSTLRRAVVPALLALIVVAEISTALVGSASIRSDQRKAAAIAAEKRAVAAYRVALQPLAIRVFDAVQPLQDVDDAFATVAPGQLGARDDVLAHSGAVATLTAVGTSLRDVRVPKSLHSQGATLSADLAGLQTAAKALAAATTAKGDRTGFVSEFGSGFDLLLSAESNWIDALQAVYGKDLALPTPGADRSGAHGRSAPTKGGFLQQADLTCARGGVDLDRAGKITDLDTQIRYLPQHAAIIRRTGKALLALRTDAASAAFQHRLGIELKAHEAYPTALEAIVRAAKARDVNAYDAAQKDFAQATLTLRDLSRSFKAYGATVCSNYYNVDSLLAPTGGKGTLTT
jgi:hypothetical protein